MTNTHVPCQIPSSLVNEDEVKPVLLYLVSLYHRDIVVIIIEMGRSASMHHNDDYHGVNPAAAFERTDTHGEYMAFLHDQFLVALELPVPSSAAVQRAARRILEVLLLLSMPDPSA